MSDPPAEKVTPWIHTYGFDEAEAEAAKAFDVGWKAGKAAAPGAAGPFLSGTVEAAAFAAAVAFHKELSR